MIGLPPPSLVGLLQSEATGACPLRGGEVVVARAERPLRSGCPNAISENREESIGDSRYCANDLQLYDGASFAHIPKANYCTSLGQECSMGEIRTVATDSISSSRKEEDWEERNLTTHSAV